MKTFLVWLLLCSLTCSLLAQEQVQDKPLSRSQPRPSAATVEAWQDRKFGMFIHFGLYSELGGVWQGKKINNGYSEQIMANAPIPLEEYAATAKSFNPTKWDPDAIVALAKAAGMKYIVITSKHHDGFNLFHTAQTKYNIVDATPYHRDIVKELAEACKRGGIAFGVYYSSIDWHQPGMDRYIEGNSNLLSEEHARFNAAQLKELLSNYGPISEIWFDMGKPTPEQSKLFVTTVHQLQPQTMVSGRVWNYEGDFAVMGDNEVPEYGIGEPWQTPASFFNDTWGYRSWQKRENVKAKIDEEILRMVRVVSRGGNFILNIGPEGDGSVVPYEEEALRGIGAWMKLNGEAIYGTKASPFAELSFGYATQRKDAVYLFVEKFPSDGVLHLPDGGSTDWSSARILSSGKTLKLSKEQGDTFISIGRDDLAGTLPVLKLTYRGKLVVDKAVLPYSSGTLVLNAKNAERFYNYNGQGYEAPETLYKLRWLLPRGCASMTFHVRGEGRVSLLANGAAKEVSLRDGAKVSIVIGDDQSFELTPPEPFLKGTALPVVIESIDASAQSCRD